MLKIISARLCQTLLVIFCLVSATFFLLRALPGSPFDSENALAPEVRDHLEKTYHLNDPVMVQYFHYVKSLSLGDLGKSYRYLDQNTADLLRESLPVTLELGFMTLLFSFLIGIPAGLMAARFHNRIGDRLILISISVGGSAPTFLLAPVLILAFSFWWDLLPPALWESPRHFILPVVTLGLRPATLVTRLVRSSALDHLNADYVRTARAQGIAESTLFFKFILKNSLIPLLGITGSLVAHILSGSFIVELIYAIPGLGHHFIDSVLDRDYPLVLTLTLFYGIVLSIANFLADVTSQWADPRMRSL